MIDEIIQIKTEFQDRGNNLLLSHKKSDHLQKVAYRS